MMVSKMTHHFCLENVGRKIGWFLSVRKLQIRTPFGEGKNQQCSHRWAGPISSLEVSSGL